MKKKIKEILGTMASFGILIYLGHHTYLLEWLAERYFCFLWAPILLLWVFRQEILARWLTFGAFGGLFLGQIAEDMKWGVYGVENQAAHSSYWGVGIWILTVILFIGLGLFHTWLKNRKKEKAKTDAPVVSEEKMENDLA